MVEARPTISIDLKKNRIRIHKKTLRYLNNPNYVYLLIHPGKKVLAIKGCSKKRRDAVRIDYDNNKDCEIYSFELIAQMALLKPKVDELSTYRLYGRTYEKNGVIEFDIF